MFRTSNPTLRDGVFHQALSNEGRMTLSGTLAKSGVLFLVLVASAIGGWMLKSPIVMWGGLIIAFVLALVIGFKQTTAPYLAPAYAVFKGLSLGAISYWYAVEFAKSDFRGAIPLAVLGTIVVFGVMLALYATRIIKVTQTFVAVVAGATLAIMLTYLATIVLSMFWPGVSQLPIYQAGPIGIGFSLFAIVVAAMNLALDFRIIEDGVSTGAPRYMEWYAGFALLVTIVWIYLELLRLLRLLSSNR